MQYYHSISAAMNIPFCPEWDGHSIPTGIECNHSIPVGMEPLILEGMEWSFHSGRNGMTISFWHSGQFPFQREWNGCTPFRPEWNGHPIPAGMEWVHFILVQ